MSMSSEITGPRRAQVWQADAEWPDDAYVVPAEDHDVVTADRDIKAANLQSLVGVITDFADNLDFDALRAAVDLARSLKQ